ncbi:Ig-like domain-containing protein [Pseudomonas sp. NPDC090202]|uniref:Ig-like domain-containing protein n=1 Tax=unclassified Pseudomonas TaxID=196821 RepID=UPI0037FAD77B
MWWSTRGQGSRGQDSRGQAMGKARASADSPTPAAPLIVSLEPRMLFDGAVAATVADTAAQADTHAATDAAKAPTANGDHASTSKDSHGQADATPAATPVAVPGQSVVFVDSRVKDADSLLQGIAPGTQIVKLDASKDGLQQIADYLDQHHGVSSVQIIAHGNAGDLWLGDTYLSADNITARSAVLAQIGQDMNVGGDILIYGCYTAEGERGLSFVDSLAQLTGRDIAASSNRTGVGGDWDLEIATGSIESVNVLSTQAMSEYQWGLATWTATNNANTGVGSLRAAIASAQNGDIVTFSAGMTVQLTSELLINKNITVDGDLNNDGVADVTLDGQYKTRVVEINSGSTVTLDGLVITRGLVSGNGGNGGYGATGAMGGGIFNAGILTLKNVSVTGNAAAGGGGGGGVTGANYGGGGGGGGGLGGQGGGHGGTAGPGTGTLGGQAGSGGVGGYGGGYDATHMGGRGGSTIGGAGGIGVSYYSNGGNGGTANNGTLSIGGGGGGSGWDKVGGVGGNAAGGIYNASTGTLKVIGTSVISNNIGAGGGGGGGSGQGSNNLNGGDGGRGVGAIWNQGGTVLITASNFSNISGNAAGSGSGGSELGGGVTGSVPLAFAAIYNNGGTLNTAYVEPPTATIVVSTPAQHVGTTSQVTFTFSRAVTGFTNADLTIEGGTLTSVSSSDGGVTWTATFTPNNNLTDATNVITLDNTGVTAISDGVAGVGTTTSNNYTIDTQRPTASIAMSDTALKIGDTSLVTITFSEAVTGFTNADLTIANGTLSAVSSSDGGITWTATFTPTASITDSTNLITLDNTGIADLASNAGSGTTSSTNYAIDTVRPTATIVVADNDLRAGETSLVTFTFSEAVSGFTNADLTIANGTLTAVSSSDGGITWTATFTPSANVNNASNLISLNNTGVADLAGNAGTGSTNSNNYAISTQQPTATIVVADNGLTVGETSLVTITFNEAVTGFTNADLTIANGTLSAVSSSDGGITWTATLTPTANITDSTNLITLDNSGVQNASGNSGAGTTNSNNYAIDTQRPTATVVVADNSLKIGETSLVTITFSEAVIGFTNADLTIANGNLTAVSSSDGGITWTATFTPTANITDSTNLISLDNTGVTDQAGNAGSGSTDSNNYAIDTQRPTATIVMADPSLTAGETSLVTITFSEAVTGFTNADLTVPNGTLTAVSSSDGGITWTATFTPTAGISDSTNIISLNNTGIADIAGNAGSGTTSSGNFTIDTMAPTATIVVADSSLKIGETSLVTITFSEAVTGFTNADLSIANGTLSAVSTSDGGLTWTATLTPTASITDASNVITLDNSGVQGVSSGNAGVGVSNSNNYAIDTQRPTATIVVADTALGVGQTSQVTITFSEAVSGFTVADLTVENGTLSGLTTSDNITWTATLTPMAGVTDTTNLITFDTSGVTDAAGNTGSGITLSNNYVVDSQRPTATIVMTDTDLRPGETSQVTITFSEKVTGFDNSDLSVANGTLSAVSSADGGTTWTATFTPNVGVNDTTNLIVLNNTGITDLAGNAGTGTTSSANYTVFTQVPTATIVVSDPSLKVGETSLVTITFSEAVTGFDNSDLTIANGTLSDVTSGDGGITWTATFTPTANVTDPTNLVTLNNSGVQNLAGNAGVGTTDSNNFSIDTERPHATIVVADSTLGIGETTQVTITFNEAVTGFGLGDLTTDNGVLSNLSSSDGGITWTATLTPFTVGTIATNTITLDNSGVADLAGNTGTGATLSNNYVIDNDRPTATITLSDTELHSGETSVVTITFSEAVSGFDLSDLSVANGTLSNLSSSDGGVTWTATLTPASGVNNATNVISLDNSGYTDLAGNSGTGTTDSANYSVQTLAPTSTIVVADTSLTAGETTLVTITFSDAVTGFDLSDLSVANGHLSGLSSSDGGITWTATLTPNANVTDSTNLITLNNAGVQNLGGSPGVGTTVSNNYAIDTARPTASIVVADPILGIGKSTTVTITFSETVSGFDLSDLSVANGVLSNLTSSDGGKTWTATLTPTANVTDPSNLIVLDTGRVFDAAGNTGSQIAISNNYALDADRPTATIVIANPNLKDGQSTLVTFTFSEAVKGFDLSDLSVANGTLSNLSSSDGGKTWTATLTAATGVTDPSNFITLDTSNVTDLAGNAGSSFANSNNFAINPPTQPTQPTQPGDPATQVGDTEFLVHGSVAPALPSLPDTPLQPVIFAPPRGDLGAPLGFPPLFEVRTSGADMPPLGSIFINNGALAHSFIAQVFGNLSTSDGNGSGFLGFGGGDGGVFGSSTLSGVFNRDTSSESSGLKTFDRPGGAKSLGDPAQGLRGIFGAPSLGQQLQQLRDTEQQQLHALAWALSSKEIGTRETEA